MATNHNPLLYRGSSYKPKEVEEKWYGKWEKDGYFGPHRHCSHRSVSSRPSEESWLGFNNSRAATEAARGSRWTVASSGEIVGSHPAGQLSQSGPVPIISGTVSGTTSESSQPDERLLASSQTSVAFGDSGIQHHSETSPFTSASLVNPEEVSKRSSLDDHAKKIFTIFAPPQNITGDLHCGHALAVSLQDALARYYRMKGFKTLFLPGSDHAGVATQCIVERKLIREKGLDRHKAGRPRFTKYLIQWKEEHCSRISSAFRRLGASMDWTRKGFAMDSAGSKAATEAFVRLYEQGVVHRGSRVVNWCPTLQTAISERDVNVLRVNGPASLKVPGHTDEVEFGFLYYYKYVIIKDDNTIDWIQMATTRPELLLADSGIAVHPDDKRHAHLIGLSARHPYSGRLLPIVGDFTVDPKFGTGAMSVAPGHSEGAFEIGKRSQLRTVVIFKEDGTVNDAGGLWKGQQRFELRSTIIENLEERGLFIKKEPCEEILQICNRSGDIIEPISKSQWWIRAGDLVEDAAEAVRDGRIKMRPGSVEKEYLACLQEQKDWCLSRNLWWGQRIPAWFLSLKEEERNAISPDVSNPKRWMVGRTEEEARRKGEEAFPDKPFRLTRDESVLDTWFSAAIWPLSALGWPRGTDFQEFYPTNILDTGVDTLISSVTRMIMVGLKLTGEAPFREVLFHPLVTDLEGRKMSNSMGNVVDPVDIITGSTLEALEQKLLKENLAPSNEELERTQKFQATCFPDGIPECGADAVRFALINYTADSQNILLDVKVVAKCRAFCDGLYETVHGAIKMLPSDYKPTKSTYGQRMAQRIGDRYILHMLNTASREIEGAMEMREFSKATRAIKELWGHYIPTYLEYYQSCEFEDTESESLSATEILYTVLDFALRMTHPVMPFITEELWQKLPRYVHDDALSIMVAEFPRPSPEYECPYVEEEFGLVMRCSKGIRSLDHEFGRLKACMVYIKSADLESRSVLARYMSELLQLAGKMRIELLRPGDDAPIGSISRQLSENLSIHLGIGTGPPILTEEMIELRLKLEAAQRTVLRQENKLRESALRDPIDERERKVEEARLVNYKTRVKNYEKAFNELSSHQM